MTCPCCGHRTLSDGPGAFEVCPVCGWEDDGLLSSANPTVWTEGPNGISLAEGQRRVARYGSSMPGDTSSRPARAGEEQDPDWRPVDDPAASPFQDYVRDLAHLVYREAQQATDDVRRGGDERARGRLQAWTDAVALLMSQAEVFGMSAEDIGLPDQLDPGRDFSPETPSGRYAG